MRTKASLNRRIEQYFISTTIFFVVIYVIFIVEVVGANFFYTNFGTILKSLLSAKTFHSIYLSLVTSSIATFFALLVGIPSGYLLSRFDFPGKRIFDMIMKIPITLPPLVAGFCLLIFFTTPVGHFISDHIVNFSFSIIGIALAQFLISASFAVITLKATFDEIDPSYETAARSLGCNRFQAFFKTTLPAARFGLASAIVLTWSRAIGEFLPVLLFCGAMEGKTDILPIAIFMHIQLGNLEEAIGLTFIFILLCLMVIPLAQMFIKMKDVDA